MPTIEQGLSAGERIAGSTAPALVLCVLLLVMLCGAIWITVRRQRLWVEKQVTEMRDELTLCRDAHRVCMARGARRTSLLLQVLAIAESFVDALRREEDRKRLGQIRMAVEQLLEEEHAEAMEESKP